MSSETTFGPVPEELLRAPPGGIWKPIYGELQRLNNALPRGQTPYTWGWTIFRTVCTPESDNCFSAAVDKLQRWLACYVEINKFPATRRRVGWPAEPVNELARRRRNDVVQDRQLDTTDWAVVYDAFKRWVLQHNVTESDFRFDVVPSNVRYNSFIIIDQAALEALENLPENRPPLTEEMALTPNAWVWVVCTKTLEQKYRASIMRKMVIAGE